MHMQQQDVPLVFRRARAADVERIVVLLEEALPCMHGRHKGLDVSPPEASPYLEAFYDLDNHPDHALMVAVAEQGVVGVCHVSLVRSLYRQGMKRIRLESFRVCPSMRSQGIGRTMLDNAMAWGRSRGALACELTTHCSRERALGFYERAGFKTTYRGMERMLDGVDATPSGGQPLAPSPGWPAHQRLDRPPTGLVGRQQGGAR